MPNTETKILNLEDGMSLAQIISKYFDTESIKEMTGEEFAFELFSKAIEEDVIKLLILFGGIKEGQNRDFIISECIKWMIKNNFLDLLEAYKKLGFSK